jgi:hypothetical protein
VKNTECVCNAIEESEQRCDVYSFGNLSFFPSCKAQLLNIFGGGSVSSLGDQFRIVQQGALGWRKAGFVKLAFDDCCYTLIGCSLDPQEVGMAVHSIRTPVQIRDVAGDHLFVAAQKIPCEKWIVFPRSITRRRKSGRPAKHLRMPGTCCLRDPARQKS